MISVEQIRALEERIEKALSFIASLRAENASLEGRLSGAESLRARAEARAEEAELRVLELEEAADAFRQDQARIEEGILHALEKLDAFEDLVLIAGSVAGNGVAGLAKAGASAGSVDSRLRAEPEVLEAAATRLPPAAGAIQAEETVVPAEASSELSAEAEPFRPEAEPPARPSAEPEEPPAAQVGELDIF